MWCRTRGGSQASATSTGNGVSDILRRNDNGAVSIWDNGQIGGAHIVARRTDRISNDFSRIADTGDYDGNGRSDVSWRSDNGAVSVWDNGQIRRRAHHRGRGRGIQRLGYRLTSGRFSLERR